MIYIVITKVQAEEAEISAASFLPSEVKNYIKKPTSKKVREERRTAYSLLYSALFEFFGEKYSGLFVEWTKEGKPRFKSENHELKPESLELKSENPKNKEENRELDGCIPQFNLSHSDGVVALVLSDNGEIGIDIQGEIDESTADRIEKRYKTRSALSSLSLGRLSDFESDVALMYASLEDKEFTYEKVCFGKVYSDAPKDKIISDIKDETCEGEESLEKTNPSNSLKSRASEKPIITPPAPDDFGSRWSAIEACIKCEGSGFINYGETVKNISEYSISAENIKIGERKYSLAIAVKKHIDITEKHKEISENRMKK